MDSFSKRLGLALAISFVAVACASPTIPNQSRDEEDISDPSESASSKKAATKKPSTQTATPPESDAPGGDAKPNPSPTPNPNPTPNPTPTGGSCAAAATGEACFTCCDQASGGDLAKAEDVFGACACEQGGECAAACGATFCNNQEPSAACDTCLTQKCDPAAAAACTSAACKAGEQCLQTSCAGKQ